MKMSRAFALVSLSLALGFLAARWCAAQSAHPTPNQEPKGYDFGALQQLNSFVSYLQQTGQTNTLQRFNDYANASLASQNNAELGVTVAVLQRLRDGRTNEACQLLEGQLDGYIVGFAAAYRELSPQLREQGSLKLLGRAKEYRAKFPIKHPYPVVDKAVADAFNLLDETTK
jgi:hypothetical protein